MLEKQINGFIDYCKVSGFKVKSIKSLSNIIVLTLMTVYHSSFQGFFLFFRTTLPY